MRLWQALAIALFGASCGFKTALIGDAGGAIGGDSQPAGPDASMHAIDAHVTPIADAAGTCFGTGLVTACFVTPPTTSFTVATGSDQTIDTDTDTKCATLTLGDDTTACLIADKTIDIKANVRVVGGRPLVLLATTTLKLSGTLDASSAGGGTHGGGSNPTTCGTPTAGKPDTTGAGGGAGGTFGTKGGAGATGGSNAGGAGGTAVAVGAAPTVLRGGCPGAAGGNAGGGAPGAGGGALYLIAGTTLTISSAVTIDASGAGGLGGNATDGGGGAGAGGMIGLDAMTLSIDPNADIYANGGGGGEGGGTNDAGFDGDDPSDPASAANGGSGNSNGGNGGNGAVGSGNGSAGHTDTNGGGGGGGGAGVILMYPPQTGLSNNVSPPPS